MNKSIIAAIVAGSLAVPVYTLAQSTPRIDQRQEKQDERIERGIEKGQITKKEARRLEKARNTWRTWRNGPTRWETDQR